MSHAAFVAIYLVVMGALIVTLDILFLQHHFWWRLGTNLGVVATFASVYLLFLKDAFK